MADRKSELPPCTGCRKLLEAERTGAMKDAEHSAVLDNINASLRYLRADHKELLGVLFDKVAKQDIRITRLTESIGERIAGLDKKMAAWGGGLAAFLCVMQLIGLGLQLWLATKG